MGVEIIEAEEGAVGGRRGGTRAGTAVVATAGGRRGGAAMVETVHFMELLAGSETAA